MSELHTSKSLITGAAIGKTIDGKTVEIFTLRNRTGMEARVMTYGGIVTSFTAPDRNGRFADIVLGFDHLDGYTKNSYLKSCPYFGAIIGRYANRIGHARFTLGGKSCKLAANNGPNSLHGGIKGFDKVVWNAKVVEVASGPALELAYSSKDGEEGFPGNLASKVVYSLLDRELRIDFSATTDAPTLCNLTNHSYFNLAGGGDVLGHELCVSASRFTPVDGTLIPTGELQAVEGTPFDFRKPASIGARIRADDDQLKLGSGYDQNFVIDKPPQQLGLHARVREPGSGRVLEMLSTEPGMQFYTANHLDGTLVGKGGMAYQRFGAFCLEPQRFPDSPNKPQFPSAVLRPGEIYRHTIIYRISTDVEGQAGSRL